MLMNYKFPRLGDSCNIIYIYTKVLQALFVVHAVETTRDVPIDYASQQRLPPYLCFFDSVR